MRRRILRRILRGLPALLLLPALYVLLLARPTPLFAHSGSLEGFTLYTNRALEDDPTTLVREIESRVRAMEGPHSDDHYRVFLCDSERLYGMFARLCRLSPNSLALGLSFLGNIYVNEPKLHRFAASPGRIPHSRYEGNLAEVVAHEIAHFQMIDVLGLRGATSMPMWKSEGWAEYQANLAATRADPNYDLRSRVALIEDLGFWGYPPSYARELFETHVLVEFLAEERDVDLASLADPAVTLEWVRSEMQSWYAESPPTRREGSRSGSP